MIGRIRETKELNRLYDSGRAELVAIYGRRRIGKTYPKPQVQTSTGAQGRNTQAERRDT